jgi:hypothetical protein
MLLQGGRVTKERQMLFSAQWSGPSLEGRKSQTRRVARARDLRAAGMADHAQAISCTDGHRDNGGLPRAARQHAPTARLATGVGPRRVAGVRRARIR